MTENENGTLEILNESGETVSTDDSFEIAKDTSFYWNIEVSEASKEHKLLIIGEDKTETVTVIYDFETGTYAASISE